MQILEKHSYFYALKHAPHNLVATTVRMYTLVRTLSAVDTATVVRAWVATLLTCWTYPPREGQITIYIYVHTLVQQY